MRNLMILVKMQLKERLNFKRSGVNGVKLVDLVLSVLGPILKFVAVTVLCAALFLVANMLNIFGTYTVPSAVVSVIFSVMLALSVLSCIVGLTKSMYYARDNAVLLTLPAKPWQVYLSKLIIFTIFELKKNLSFIVPFFVAYYYTHNYPIGAYPWLLICIFFVSLFTVSIGALLSIPSMLVANFFRQYKWLQIATLAVAVSAGIAAVFWGISLIPEDINIIETWGTTVRQIREFLKAYTVNFSWLYDITLMMLGETSVYFITTFPIVPTAIRFGILVGATAALFALGILIVQPLFYSMASKPFEYLKKKVDAKPNKARGRRWSSIFTEWLVAFKSTGRTFANFGILVSVPMMIFLLNKIFLAMATRDVGDYMIVSFNVLIILLVMLNSNSAVASIYSREGRSSYLIKTQPCDPPLLIVSKLLPNATFSMVSLVATFVILIFTLPIEIYESVMLCIALACIYLAHLFFSAELDLMNPEIEMYATVGSAESNPNETKSTVVAFIAAFAVAGLFFLLLLEPGGENQYLKLLLVSAAVLAYTVWMFFTKLRLYYKEK